MCLDSQKILLDLCQNLIALHKPFTSRADVMFLSIIDLFHLMLTDTDTHLIFSAGGTVACVWHSSLKVMGSIPSLTQPKKAHQGGNAQVESYLNDPRKGTV